MRTAKVTVYTPNLHENTFWRHDEDGNPMMYRIDLFSADGFHDRTRYADHDVRAEEIAETWVRDGTDALLDVRNVRGPAW